ncbi:MAG: DUF47 domain-containing protein [Endomicrobiia bacterium]
MVHLFEWLGRKKEKDIFIHSLEHFEKVLESVLALKEAVKLFVKGENKEELIKLLHKIAQAEHEADAICRKLVHDIAVGEILPADHENLLFFVYRIDSIADCAHAAERYIALWEGKFLESASSDLIAMTDTAVEATQKLKLAVSKLNERNFKEALELCTEIEQLEDKGDDQMREISKKILSSSLSVAHILLARDLVNSIETISDSAKIGSDMLRVLIAGL